MQKLFETTDLYLVAAISIFSNTTPEFKFVNHKVIFAFPADDDIYRAVAQFNSGDLINVFEFTQRIKRFRAEMFTLKSQGQKNEIGELDQCRREKNNL